MGYQSIAAWSCIFLALLSRSNCETAPTPTTQEVGKEDELGKLLQRANRQAVDQLLPTLIGSAAMESNYKTIASGVNPWLLLSQAQGITGLLNGVSSKCINQTMFMLKNASSPWAAAMFDSFGRRSAGILLGNLKWLGEFDECVNAKTEAAAPMDFHGRYCQLPWRVAEASPNAVATVGGCFPSGCSSEDIKELLLTIVERVTNVNRTDKSLEGFFVNCQAEEKPLNAGAIVAICLGSVFGAFLLIGTLYDVAAGAYSCLLRDFFGTQAQQNLWHAEQVQLSDSHISEPSDAKVASLSLTEMQPAEIKASTENEASYNSVDQHQWQSAKAHSKVLDTLKKFLLCFSVYSNGKKLLACSSQGASTLQCLNGIRFLSMCWVVLGHTYLFSGALLSDGDTFFKVTSSRKTFMAIVNAQLAVDTFFLLSGLLVTYIMLKELNKRKGHLKLAEWVLLYVHRYLRLTGVYAIVLLAWICLTYYIYNGPMWWTSNAVDPACTDKWWTNLVYVNNFIEEKPGINCMGWTWYLANDMQMFLIAPPLAFIIYKFWPVGISITALLTLGSVVASAVIAKDVNYTQSILISIFDPLRNLDVTSKHYIKPWVRFQPYGVGIILAFLIQKWQAKGPLPKVLALMGWIIAAGSCLSALYGPYETFIGSRQFTHTVNEMSIYAGLCRLAWALGVGWMIFTCCTGQGGWINTLLSWKPFIPLSRLCYCAYLIHPIVMIVLQQGSRDLRHFDDSTMIIQFLGQLTLVLATSFLTSLAFEAPLLRIEKLAFGSGS